MYVCVSSCEVMVCAYVCEGVYMYSCMCCVREFVSRCVCVRVCVRVCVYKSDKLML